MLYFFLNAWLPTKYIRRFSLRTILFLNSPIKDYLILPNNHDFFKFCVSKLSLWPTLSVGWYCKIFLRLFIKFLLSLSKCFGRFQYFIPTRIIFKLNRLQKFNVLAQYQTQLNIFVIYKQIKIYQNVFIFCNHFH